MSKKPSTRIEKYKREQSKVMSKIYDLVKEKEYKKQELETYCKSHTSISFDLLKTCEVDKLDKIYAYFDKNKSYIRECELGLRCDNRGMQLYFWLYDDPDYLVLHLSSNNSHISLSGSTSWIIKAPELEDKIKILKMVKADITKIIEGE